MIVKPLLRNAISWKRRESVSNEYVVVSKIVSSAQNVMVVPVSLDLPSFSSGAAGRDATYGWKYLKPSRWISTSSFVDSALTTLTPTPCRPPETAYEPA